MTPDQIARLRMQLRITQQALADRINAIDPFFRATRQTVYKWESGNRHPDARSASVLTRVWLHEGYPCTVDGRPATLTTNHAASSWGQPVVLIDGIPHGSGDITMIDLGDAPETVRLAVTGAGYGVTT